MNNIDLAKIAQEYREFNPSSIFVLDRPPSALEFARLIHIARPVLIKNSKHIDYQQWTPNFLTQSMADNLISVAITPQGQGADALATGKLGDTFTFLIIVLTTNARSTSTHSKTTDTSGEVLYLQSQNGNLYPGSPSEFQPLLPHVPPEISWASEALGRPPDAVNLWIGDNRSITSIHAGETPFERLTNSSNYYTVSFNSHKFRTDPYENIYTVVRGVKYFTLVPPTEAYTLHEKIYPHAQYTRSSSGSLTLAPTSKVVRWSSIKDPSIPGVLSAASPYRIVVHAGDTLYLPPGWWHYVKQTVDETGICVALNWWYDMEMQGMNWIWLQCMRGTLGDGNDKSGEEEEE